MVGFTGRHNFTEEIMMHWGDMSFPADVPKGLDLGLGLLLNRSSGKQKSFITTFLAVRQAIT